MTLKNIQKLLPVRKFLRINRSYIINRDKVDSFDANDVFIKECEIAISNNYREIVFTEFLTSKT